VGPAGGLTGARGACETGGVLVLAVNCGSSSLKARLYEASAATERPLARALVERIGGDAVVTTAVADGAPRRESRAVPDHDAAVAAVVERLAALGLPKAAAIGHRIVHGGTRYVAPTRIDDGVVAALTALEELAPLHNGPGVAGIRACRARFGSEIPMVAVFDTAFHATLPEVAWRYALPTALADRHAIRRYGFHGISYEYALARYAELTGRAADTVDMIALHLGNGASIAAIRGGRSVDTSMGFTPLEGLVMGTRSGDLDPAVVGVLAEREGVAVGEVERWLNERSGLLGLSGTSRDMRDLLGRADTDPRARLAVDVFCHRARKYVGAYLATLGRVDALVFTGGIGEHAAPVRAAICAGLEAAGIVLDPAANIAARGDARIDAPRSRVDVRVIAADEERMIARRTRALLEA
jgi:acetate kinase